MKYAVVDIETTGNNILVDEIIQLGIAIYEDGKIEQTYDTFIHATQDIPPFIEALTGIKAEDIANAPRLGDVADEIVALLDGAVFVAHNINFDLGFLQHYLEKEGYTFKPKYMIDTVDVFKVVFPCEKSYQLSSLATSLDIKLLSAHNAMADAYATAEIFALAVDKLKLLPKALLIKLYHYAKKLKYDFDQLLFEIISNHQDAQQFKEKYGLTYYKQDAKLPVIELDISFQEYYAEVIRKNDLVYRKDQLFLAETILSTLIDEDRKMIEAEVGSGKSLAYLLAATYYMAQYDENVLVTTATKALQHQLLYNDAAKIEQVTGRLPLLLLKSKRNYLSLEFVKFILQSEKENHDVLLLKMQLLVFLMEPYEGDIEALNLTGGRKVFFELMQSMYKPKQDTYLYEDIRKITNPILGITNHSHLLHSGKEGFPKYFDNIIIDEGHQLQEIALSHTYDEWRYQDIKFQLNQLTNEEHFLRYNKESELLKFSLYQVRDDILQLEAELDEFFQTLHETQHFEMIDIEHAASLAQLSAHFQDALQKLQQLKVPELERQLRSLKVMVDALYYAVQKDKTAFYQMGHSKGTLTLYVKRSTLSEVFSRMRQQFKAMVLLSGTLLLDGSMKYLKPIFKNEQKEVIKFDPIHRDEKVTFFIPDDVPLFKHDDADDYIEKIVLYITAYLENGHQKMLALFNNYNMLRAVSSYLDETTDHVVIAQSPGANAHKLMSQFNQLDTCIMLGTQSFYEGLDYASDSFKCVMIATLPFIHPSDKRVMLMMDETSDPFKEYQLPYAATKIRQAAGRLIRKESDQGIIICMDRRIVEASYSSIFNPILQQYALVRGNLDELLRLTAKK